MATSLYARCSLLVVGNVAATWTWILENRPLVNPTASSTVAVEPDALEAEAAGRDAQMSPLVALVPVHPPPADPLTTFVAAFLDIPDPRDRIARRIRTEGDDDAVAGSHVFIGSRREEDAAGLRPALGALSARPAPGVVVRDLQRILAQVNLPSRRVFVEYDARHRAQALVLQDQRRQLLEQVVAAGEWLGSWVIRRLDGERTEPDRIVLSDRIEHVDRPFGAPTGFRDEQRIA